MERMAVAHDRPDADDRPLMRLGGISAVIVGLSYPIIIALFLIAGPKQPVGEGGRAWLEYLSGNEATWWAIVGLSVLTNILWIPVAWAFYRSLASVGRAMVLAGSSLLVLFVILELATSWTNYAVLIELSSDLGAATDEAQRTAVLGAAGYAAAAQSSSLLPFYAILVPALGQLLIGLVMLRGGPFGRATASLTILVGVIGIVSVLGRFVWEPLGQAIIAGSLLMGVWFLLVGWRFLRLGASRQETDDGVQAVVEVDSGAVAGNSFSRP